MEKLNILEILNQIDPARLNYQEWVNVGMALQFEGYTASDWDQWSSKDSKRYVAGECFKKWGTFQGAGVTGGTIVQYAKDQGMEFYSIKDGGHELDWDAVIGEDDDLVIIEKNWIEGKEINEPINWNPVKELVKYLETLFESNDYVGYVTDTWKTEKGSYAPKAGAYDRTAGQLIEELNKCNGDISLVVGDYKKEAGAWIRFNPLNGKGVKNDNVTDYRFALVESDNMELEKQNAIIRELELPIACLVHSGNKSLHAIVRIEAATYDEYRKRVDYLYNVCRKNGLQIDTQNRNPSRLSRMPGIERGDRKQFIIDTNIGKRSWEEWFEWIEGINDDLPEPESLKDVWNNLPELAPPLIDGVLRQGHKMLMAGPSKAGKSFALIELCIAIAEGTKWLDWQCSQGKVLYVNLELDRASCLHRFEDVYKALGITAKCLDNVDIWNLRGKSVPMDKLAPKLIRRAAKKNYIAIVIDPIYKIITGDENSADQMAHFTNQFDKVCTELGSSVIYCHHHSKGYQGGKRSMDRASGSGVFARDPDALIDLVDLHLSEGLIKQEKAKMERQVYLKAITDYNPNYLEKIGPDEMFNTRQMREHIQACLPKPMQYDLDSIIEEIENTPLKNSAWRIEGTLREFPKFEPVNLWFDYPIHIVDDTGVLSDIDPEGEFTKQTGGHARERGHETRRKQGKVTQENIASAIENANFGEPPTIEQVQEYLENSGSKIGKSKRTIENFIRENSDIYHKKNIGNNTWIIEILDN